MSPTQQADRYQVLEALGSGATSRVDKARDTVIGRTVALKTFLPGFGKGREEQFLVEAQTIGQLSHSTIAQLYDVGTDTKGAAYLVMEYVPGKTLEQVLAEGPVPLQCVAVWGADLASGLACAHRAGIIHGDVKPGNILVTENDHVKLVDFGVARFASQVSVSGLVSGTPAYLAPEQIEGEKQDGHSDLFSLGIVLYEMATGERPFAGSSLGAVCAQILAAKPVPPSKRNPALPAAFDRIIARCLAKKPQDRYQSGDDLARALYLLVRSNGQQAVRPKQPSWFKRPLQKRDLWAFASAVLLLASVVSAASALRHHRQSTAATTPLNLAPPKPSVDALLPPHAAIPYNPADITPIIPDPPLEPAPKLAPAPHHKHTASRVSHERKTTRATQDMQTVLPVATPAVAEATPSATSATVQQATLRIEIFSTINDATLAIFDGQELLSTSILHSDFRDTPLRFERTLPAGKHQFRAVLYRGNKTVQAQKEGTGELRGDATNNLEVHVSRRAKLLVLREPLLEVSWPSGQATAVEHASNAGSSSGPSN
jgi:serine/threonine protein kinase